MAHDLDTLGGALRRLVEIGAAVEAHDQAGRMVFQRDLKREAAAYYGLTFGELIRLPYAEWALIRETYLWETGQ